MTKSQSLSPSLSLPPEVMLISAVNQTSGKQESSFCWSTNNTQIVDRITNDLIFGAPSRPVTSPPPTPPPVPSIDLPKLKKLCKKHCFTYSLSSPPPPSPLSNLIIYLPGSGETNPTNNFCKLASAMDLPQCCSLFLLGKHEIPFGLGWGWYQEMDYETGGGLLVNSKERRETFESAVSSVTSLLESVADISPLENVFLLSYASGADVAMEVASQITFGGCMCFRGGGEFRGEREDKQRRRQCRSM